MANRDEQDSADRDSVIVEHKGGSGALVAAIGLVVALIGLLLYFDLLAI